MLKKALTQSCDHRCGHVTVNPISPLLFTIILITATSFNNVVFFLLFFFFLERSDDDDNDKMMLMLMNFLKTNYGDGDDEEDSRR